MYGWNKSNYNTKIHMHIVQSAIISLLLMSVLRGALMGLHGVQGSFNGCLDLLCGLYLSVSHTECMTRGDYKVAEMIGQSHQ